MSVNRSQKATSNYKGSNGKVGKSYVSFSGNGKNSIGDKLVNIIMWIPNKIIDISCFFLKGRGRGIIGLGIFIFGLLISADAYWQAGNPGLPALTGFGVEPGKESLNLFDSFMLFFSPYWDELSISIFFSTIVQVIEGLVIRGSTPEEAKGSLDYYSNFDAGSEPSGKINRAKLAHSEYKNAGMLQFYLLGFAGLICWVIDFVMTFQAHNPLQYWGNPLQVATVLGINLIKVFAAESGFAIMLKLNGRG